MKKYFKFVVTLVIILNLTTNMASALLQVPSENNTQKQELDRLQKTAEKQNEILTEILVKLSKLDIVEEDIRNLKGFNKELTEIYSIQDFTALKKEVESLKKLRDYGIGIMLVVSALVQFLIRAFF